jgi:uncharacterized protein YcbX
MAFDRQEEATADEGAENTQRRSKKRWAVSQAAVSDGYQLRDSSDESLRERSRLGDSEGLQAKGLAALVSLRRYRKSDEKQCERGIFHYTDYFSL